MARLEKNMRSEAMSEVIEKDTSCDDDRKVKVRLEGPPKPPRRQKAHSKVKSKQSLVAGVLEGLEEDVFEVGQSVSMEVNVGQNSVLEHAMSERLFVQNKKGFELTTRDKVFQETFHNLTDSNGIDSEKKEMTSHDFAIIVYQKNRLFFSFCHGILGGFGAAHISLICSIANNPEAVQSFAEGYPDFARVVQILYYILSVICFVSVLDRCDFAGLQLMYCCDFVQHRIADILIIIFYFGVLVITVICVRWDDRLALSRHNEELWKDPDESHSEFMQWKIFNLIRGTCAVAGYVTMFFGPGDDLFFVHLYNMINDKEKESNYEKTSNFFIERTDLARCIFRHKMFK